MRALTAIFVMLSSLWTVTSAQAQNDCVCRAIPESKTYQGPARNKKLIGYTINWSCDFNCKTSMNDPEAPVAKVRAFYQDYFFGENGDEGICEGIVYKMSFNPHLGREVYNATDIIKGVVPRFSKSPQLKKWSEANHCR